MTRSSKFSIRYKYKYLYLKIKAAMIIACIMSMFWSSISNILSVSLSLFLSLAIYTYIQIHIHIHIHMYWSNTAGGQWFSSSHLLIVILSDVMLQMKDTMNHVFIFSCWNFCLSVFHFRLLGCMWVSLTLHIILLIVSLPTLAGASHHSPVHKSCPPPQKTITLLHWPGYLKIRFYWLCI